MRQCIKLIEPIKTKLPPFLQRKGGKSFRRPSAQAYFRQTVPYRCLTRFMPHLFNKIGECGLMMQKMMYSAWIRLSNVMGVGGGGGWGGGGRFPGDELDSNIGREEQPPPLPENHKGGIISPTP